MVDPVVSSKFGKRPLLEVPAMYVESPNKLEISTLQEENTRKAKFDAGPPNIVYRPDGVNAPPGMDVTGSLYAPPPGPMPQHVQPSMVQQPMGMQPMGQQYMGQQPMGQQYMGQQYMGQQPMVQPQMVPQLMSNPQMLPGQMIHVPPMRLQHPPHQYLDPSGNAVPAPTFPMQPPPLYPGVHNPYPAGGGQGYFVPPAMQPYPQGMHLQQPEMNNFRLEGVLEYGHLTTVHFRNGTSNFRELPEVLKRELQKTYGQYPYTDIKIIAQGGEVHIYATPRPERDEFEREEYGNPNPNPSRMIGFGNIR